MTTKIVYPTIRSGLRVAVPSTVDESKLSVCGNKLQLLPVPKDQDLGNFLKAQGKNLSSGMCFYQHTTAVTVPPYKTVILRNKQTGVLLTGLHARKALGLGDTTARLHKNPLPDYEVYIETGSANRKVKGGTFCLYKERV